MYLYSKFEYVMRRKVIFYFSYIRKKLLIFKCNRNNILIKKFLGERKLI